MLAIKNLLVGLLLSRKVCGWLYFLQFGLASVLSRLDKFINHHSVPLLSKEIYND